jgi:hypothetical protein
MGTESRYCLSFLVVKKAIALSRSAKLWLPVLFTATDVTVLSEAWALWHDLIMLAKSNRDHIDLCPAHAQSRLLYFLQDQANESEALAADEGEKPLICVLESLVCLSSTSTRLFSDLHIIILGKAGTLSFVAWLGKCYVLIS